MKEAYEGGALQVHRCQEGWMYCGGKCAECIVNQTWTDNKSSESTHNPFKEYKEGTNDIQ